MQKDSKFVGIDVHKTNLAIAVAPGAGGEALSLGTIPNTFEAVAQLVRRLGPAADLICWYEAGGCGYTLQRQLTQLGVCCQVAAPSLIPKKPGERVKTDRRDALKLARLARSGDLTPVWIPDAPHEALRDLTRAREHAQRVYAKARQTLQAFLLRLGHLPAAGVKPASRAYEQWLSGLQLPQRAQHLVLEEYRAAVAEAKARVQRLDRAVAEEAQASAKAPVIAALQTLRGVGVLTATTVVAEVGDLTRFASPRQLMAYAGLVPSEYSSGDRSTRAGITKTGNAHLRRILVEAAHHYRHAPAIGRNLQRRQQGQAASICAISWQAQHRLYQRARRLLARGKLAQKVVVAVARELLGFLWAIGRACAFPGLTITAAATAPAT